MILDQLSVARRTTLHSLIINRVHHRDVIKHMIDSGVEQTADFLFRVQIKFDLDEKSILGNYNLGAIVEKYIGDLELDRQINIMK